jgi:uncharacterized BrkB/YihY/UPF0761 family membrane protein
MALWIIAFVVLVGMIGLGIAAVIVLAMLPGKIARHRNHPQADAINVLSWLGLLVSFGVLWVVALAWAYTQPLRRPEPEPTSATPLSPAA